MTLTVPVPARLNLRKGTFAALFGIAAAPAVSDARLTASPVPGTGTVVVDEQDCPVVAIVVPFKTARLIAPTMPSETRLLSVCHSFTAALVSVPKYPVGAAIFR